MQRFGCSHSRIVLASVVGLKELHQNANAVLSCLLHKSLNLLYVAPEYSGSGQEAINSQSIPDGKDAAYQQMM